MSGQVDKSSIRKEMRNRRRALSHDAKALASSLVCDKILACAEVRTMLEGAGGNLAVAVYLASPDELDLSAAIKELLGRGVAVVAPRWDGETYRLARLKSLRREDLREGPMGVLEPEAAEPVPPCRVAVWIVPGLAFTSNGDRLGYGGGWYDRLLAEADARAVKLGVAHGFQLVASLPREAHDLRVDRVLVAE